METAAAAMNDLFDDEGFLRDPGRWNASIAAAIARQDGLPQLTRDHWVIIRALREHYRRFDSAPPAFGHLCQANHMDRHCVAQLFRNQREAWRIAGLPDPGEEAWTYM